MKTIIISSLLGAALIMAGSEEWGGVLVAAGLAALVEVASWIGKRHNWDLDA